ncbi:uncharacterized protein LOC131004749 [Salvia miltiorrhiza]|uniref:uncharacterized protein LOC131004749 n=1 Tax=Salvia miltiorrhiza TaxID=226208 RepID=UPI0025AD1FE4|nr:uncharacterized protein LOC131004749 [Salvia miltiorrhiza]
MLMHQKSPLSTINALKPANTCFLLLKTPTPTKYLGHFQTCYNPYLLYSPGNFIFTSLFTMRLPLLLLLLLILIATSSASTPLPAHFNLPPWNDPESSTHRRTSIRLHFSRYSSAKNIAYDDDKRLVPTGANPLHNR